MAVSNLKMLTDWSDVLSAARVTRGSEDTGEEPSSIWKRKILLSEHSPIRMLEFSWTWIDIPYWVSVHFVRHKVGIEHFVRSQRKSREDGLDLSQHEPVNHHCKANAQAIINISKERLCACANQDTRSYWKQVLKAIYCLGEQELVHSCAPKCCCRGYCPEGKQDCRLGPAYFKEYRDFVSESGMRIFR